MLSRISQDSHTFLNLNEPKQLCKFIQEKNKFTSHIKLAVKSI